MSKDKDEEEGIPEYLSAADMRNWLQQEIRNAAKAFDLRVREATDFVTAYSAGELTPEQADERQWRYLHRWGEALPGAMAFDHVSDRQILKRIDESRGPYVTPKDLEATYRRAFGGKPQPPDQGPAPHKRSR
jgi:hypothetical protein